MILFDSFSSVCCVAIPVYTPRSMILSPDKLDVSSGVSLPDWLLVRFFS